MWAINNKINKLETNTVKSGIRNSKQSSPKRIGPDRSEFAEIIENRKWCRPNHKNEALENSMAALHDQSQSL